MKTVPMRVPIDCAAFLSTGEWIFGNFLCKIYMFSQSITQFSSSIFLLIMSADRYIAGRRIIDLQTL